MFEEQLAHYNEQREKELADDNILSQEQKDFYRISDDESEEESEEALIEEEILPEEEVIETELEDEAEEAEPDEIEQSDEAQEIEAAEDDNNEDSSEVNELFEAEKLAQQEAAIFVANALAENEAKEKAEEAQNSEEDVVDPFEEKEPEHPDEEVPAFYFKQNNEELNEEAPEQNDVKPQFAEQNKNFEEVKLTRKKDVKIEKKENKNKKLKKNHRTAKTVFNTLIALAVIVIVFINSVVFMADMPKRFIGGAGITVCEHSIEGSNVKSGSLLIIKKVDDASDSKVVAAVTKDKKTVVDFKQNLPEDAEVYAQTVKLIPRAGGAVKFVRNYWFESGLVELSGLLVLLIIRVALSDKKEKTETKKKSE